MAKAEIFWSNNQQIVGPCHHGMARPQVAGYFPSLQIVVGYILTYL